MSKRNLLRGLLVIVVAMGNVFARAQKSPPPAPDLKAAASSRLPSQLTEPVLERIKNIEDKMVTVAEDFPDDLYTTYRPKDALFAAGKVPTSVTMRYVSKQDTVAKVKESFAAVRKAIQDNPDLGNLEGWLYVIAHSSEHFGNLVTYYRDNGLVPPTSRQ